MLSAAVLVLSAAVLVLSAAVLVLSAAVLVLSAAVLDLRETQTTFTHGSKKNRLEAESPRYCR